MARPPRGLRLKICIVVQESRFARTTASVNPPAIETWTPSRIVQTLFHRGVRHLLQKVSDTFWDGRFVDMACGRML